MYVHICKEIEICIPAKEPLFIRKRALSIGLQYTPAKEPLYIRTKNLLHPPKRPYISGNINSPIHPQKIPCISAKESLYIRKRAPIYPQKSPTPIHPQKSYHISA